MDEDNADRRILLAVFGGLMLLLVATVAAARLPLGAWAFPVALAIAFAKTLLIATWFMHLRHAEGLVRLAAFAGLAFLLMGAVLISADYLTRG